MPEVNYFDPARWAVPDDQPPPTGPAKSKEHGAKGRKSAPFLKGPVPWSWVLQATRLGGKVLAVGLLLWKEAGCQGGRTFQFCVTRSATKEISRWTIYRAIQRLKQAGLITTRLRATQGLQITLRVKEED
jgi:hypothetical protein